MYWARGYITVSEPAKGAGASQGFWEKVGLKPGRQKDRPPGGRDHMVKCKEEGHAHGDLTSLAPHERLPEILVVLGRKPPRAPQLEETPETGGAWNATPRSLPSLERKIRSRTHA